MSPDLRALLEGSLTRSGLFAGMAAEQILHVAPRHGRRPEGALLFQQGDAGEHASLLLRGVLGLRAGGASPPGQADLILRAASGAIPFLDGKRYRESYALGYAAARRALGRSRS